MIPPSTSSIRTLRPNSTAAPAFKRGITRVCGSKSDTSFSAEETGSGPGPLRRVDELGIGCLQRLATLWIFAAGDPMELLRQLADGLDPAAERLAQDGPGPAQQPRDDADAIADEAALSLGKWMSVSIGVGS